MKIFTVFKTGFNISPSKGAGVPCQQIEGIWPLGGTSRSESQRGEAVMHESLSRADDLVGRCQKKEQSALAEFYQRYKNEVARIVYKVLGPDTELEDVVQEVFLEVFRCIDTFKGNAQFSTWLYRVSSNVALQRLRRLKRCPEGFSVPTEELPHEETPLRSLERQDSSRIVYNILDTIAPKKRMVFILHEIVGMNSKEIAQVVGTNVLTVRTRLHYARKEFYQKVIATEGFAEDSS